MGHLLLMVQSVRGLLRILLYTQKTLDGTYRCRPARGFRGIREAIHVGIGSIVVATPREGHAKTLSDAAENKVDGTLT